MWRAIAAAVAEFRLNAHFFSPGICRVCRRPRWVDRHDRECVDCWLESK